MRSLFALLVGPISLQHLVAADAKTCSATSPACCNPFMYPVQMCPGSFACEDCGGSSACECPDSAPPPSPPAPSTTAEPITAKPCSATSDACCNPDMRPVQMCPGNKACEACGSGACECPGQAPAPPPGPPTTPGPTTTLGPESYNRLTIVNGCENEAMWIAHIVAGGVGPDPQDVRINAGEQAVFATSAGWGALSATRFWPKLGCDSEGGNCAIGDSGGPGEGCVIRIPGKDDNYTQCAPPVDTKFEASFAPPGSSADDVLDMSLVDGFTLPFKLETSEGTCIRHVEPFESMDCSQLSLSHCPQNEALGEAVYDMQATNPRTGRVAGCYSPCMRLTDDKWNTTIPVSADSELAGPYCCAGAYGNPGECTTGPIYDTQYLPAVKSMCPDAYAYAYDDKIATIACTTATKYKVTFFCPAGDDAALIIA